MILLLGGTKETGPIAQSLAEAGYEVLVSTATDIPLEVGSHPKVCRRAGELKEESLATLVRERGIKGIVDCTHPYAKSIRGLARKVAEGQGIPYLTWLRPSTVNGGEEVLWAADHEEAASLAFSFGQPVFLTVGSRNLKPYARESRRAGMPLKVRILPHPASYEACRAAGVPEEDVLSGRGPFSVEENREAIRKHRIGTLVTKDSGVFGGVPEKLEAARQENCRVIVVKRPDYTLKRTFESTADLIGAVLKDIPVSNSRPVIDRTCDADPHGKRMEF